MRCSATRVLSSLRQAPFVREHYFADAQRVPAADCQQLGGAIELVAQRRVCDGAAAAPGMRLVDHEAAADRVEGILEEGAGLAMCAESQGVGVVRQAHRQQAHVVGPVERHGDLAGELQAGVALDVGDRGSDEVRIDAVGALAHQADDHRTIGAVPDAGSGQRAVQPDLDAAYRSEQLPAFKLMHEVVRRLHRADSVRARRPDANLEQIENADGH
jgi:hypothetical protein